MHGFVASGRPTGSLRDELRVITSADQKLSGRLLLEVASDAKVLVSLREQFRIHSAMGIVADSASFADGLVFKDEWTVLRDVAFATGFALAGEGERPAANGVAFVNVMAVAAADLSFQHRMVRCQVKLPTLVEMAIEARFRAFPGIHDGLSCAPALGVDASGAVT